MTTHEQQTMTDSPDESAVPAPEAPREAEESTAVEREPIPAAKASEAQPLAAAPEPSTGQALFAGDNLAELRARWAGVQAAFVDDPKECVQEADGLVSDLVEQLTAGFAETRWHLEEQWNRGEEASTEDLRVALMHYREFFERLLAV